MSAARVITGQAIWLIEETLKKGGSFYLDGVLYTVTIQELDADLLRAAKGAETMIQVRLGPGEDRLVAWAKLRGQLRK